MQTSSLAQKQKYPILNDTYEIVEEIADGKTSRVFLCQEINDRKKKVALKLIRGEYLEMEYAEKNIENEIII